MIYKNKCPLCHGREGSVEIECDDCNGTGFEPEEGNQFAQCQNCSGDGSVEVEICPRCLGEGTVEDDDS